MSCWDLSGDAYCDLPTEDLDGDGSCTVADCYGGFAATRVDQWDSAYGWGDHSNAGYLLSEADPSFAVSPAASIGAADLTSWNTAYSWGDHAAAGYMKTDNDTLAGLSCAPNQFSRFMGGAWACDDGFTAADAVAAVVPQVSAPNLSLSLNGLGEYVQIPPNAALVFEGAQPFTVELWFKRPENPVYTTRSMGLITKGIRGYGLRNSTFRLYLNDHDGPLHVEWTHSLAADEEILGTSVIDFGWHHVALTWDGTTQRLWLDGDLEGEQPAVGPGPTGPEEIYIGLRLEQTTTGYTQYGFHGLIDEVRISDVARYATPFTPETTYLPDGNTVALWQFEELGFTARDSSATGADGTFVGMGRAVGPSR